MHRMYGKPEITSLTKDLEYGTGKDRKLGISVSCGTLRKAAREVQDGTRGIFSRVPAPFL